MEFRFSRLGILAATTIAATLAVRLCYAHTVNTLYDYQLIDAQANPLSLEEISKKLADTDVILVGEWHAHPAIHLFQAKLLAQLSQRNKVSLSMEQFARSKQSVLNNYLAGKIGEQMLIHAANAWPNYKSSYRPLIEFAKENQLNVIAANAPSYITHCLARKGLPYLDKLDEKERTFIAKNFTTQDSAYKQKFFSTMPHGDNEVLENYYLAQTAWDDTMAESIVQFLASHPSQQLMHIAGSFHIEQGLGIASRIKALNPTLSIAIISPTNSKNTTNLTNKDYQLIVKSLPKKWLNNKEMNEVNSQVGNYHSLSKKNQCD